MKLILIALLSYLIGAVPFALVIGKLFFKTDIRKHGSGNLGGGNTGRVLGAKAGLAVMTLDLLKVTLCVGIALRLCGTQSAAALAAVSAALGHCWPVFARFRGGKAVAALYGFLFGIWVLGGCSPLCFFLPLGVFGATLYVTKVVALASLVSALAVTVWGAFALGSTYTAVLVFFLALTVWRHRGNLARVKRGTENKVSWL